MRGLGCAKFADGAGIYMISTDIENLFKCNILDSHSSNQDRQPQYWRMDRMACSRLAMRRGSHHWWFLSIYVVELSFNQSSDAG